MYTKLLIAIITIIFSGFFLIQSINLPTRGNIAIGPSFWPNIVLGLMLFLGLVLLVQFIMELRKNKNRVNEVVPQEEENDEASAALVPELVYPKRMWIIIILIALYILSVGNLGFIVTTLLFVLGVTWFLGMRKWIPLILTPVLSTLSLVIVFTVFLSLPLPRGMGIFREISYIFY